MSYNDEALLSDNIAHQMALAYQSKVQTLEVAPTEQVEGAPRGSDARIVNLLQQVGIYLNSLLRYSSRFYSIRNNRQEIINQLDVLKNDILTLDSSASTDFNSNQTYAHFRRDYIAFVSNIIELISLLSAPEYINKDRQIFDNTLNTLKLVSKLI